MSTRGGLKGTTGRQRGGQAVTAVKRGATIVEPYAALMLRSFIGREASPQLMRDIVGAPEGSTVRVTAYVADDGARTVQFNVEAPGLFSKPAEYYVHKFDGQLRMHIATFHVLAGQEGREVALHSLARAAKTLQELRDSHGQRLGGQITTNMGGVPWARGKPNAGLALWPLLGFDSPPGGVLAETRQAFLADPAVSDVGRARVRRLGENLRLLDLVSTQEGRDWWRAHGTRMTGALDVRPGSRSMQILQAQAKAVGIDWSTL